MGGHRGSAAFFSWRLTAHRARAAAGRTVPRGRHRRASGPRPATFLLRPLFAQPDARAVGSRTLLGGALRRRRGPGRAMYPARLEARFLHVSKYRKALCAALLHDRTDVRGALGRMARQRRDGRADAARSLLEPAAAPRDAA